MTQTFRVPAGAAQKLCEDLLEWIDTQGQMIVRNPATNAEEDNRSYKELATDFISTLEYKYPN